MSSTANCQWDEEVVGDVMKPAFNGDRHADQSITHDTGSHQSHWRNNRLIPGFSDSWTALTEPAYFTINLKIALLWRKLIDWLLDWLLQPPEQLEARPANSTQPRPLRDLTSWLRHCTAMTSRIWLLRRTTWPDVGSRCRRASASTVRLLSPAVCDSSYLQRRTNAIKQQRRHGWKYVSPVDYSFIHRCKNVFNVFFYILSNVFIF